MPFQIDIYQDAAAFQTAALPFLRARAAHLSQLLVNCERLAAQSADAPAYWLACLRDDARDEVLAVATCSLQHPPGLLMLSEWPAGALPMLVAALQPVPIQNLIAPIETAQACREAFGLTVSRGQLNNYVLERLSPAGLPLAHGHARVPAATEIGLLAGWLAAFEVECKFPTRGADAIADDLRARRAPLGNRLYEFWVVDEAPVALSAVMMAGSTARIGPVYTPPAQRGKGYAGLLVAWQSARALEEGAARVCLYADAANGTSNRLYQRIGFTLTGCFGEFGR